MEINGFRATQVCEEVGITYRQLDYWAKTDLVRPSLMVANGSGSIRRYSRNDIDMLRLIKCCIDQGITMPEVRKIVDFARIIPGIYHATHLAYQPRQGRLRTISELGWIEAMRELLTGDLFFVIPVHFEEP